MDIHEQIGYALFDKKVRVTVQLESPCRLVHLKKLSDDWKGIENTY